MLPKKFCLALKKIFFCAGTNALKLKAHWLCSLELLPLCLSFHMPPNISDRSSFSMESTSERSLTSWPSTLSGWANICGSLKATELFSRKSGDLLILRDFLPFSCLYLLCVFIFCHVCLFSFFECCPPWRGARWQSQSHLLFWRETPRRPEYIIELKYLFIIIVIITIIIIICRYWGSPREDLNVNQLNFPAMVPPPNCEFGIVNKVRFKDYSPRGSIVNDAKL